MSDNFQKIYNGSAYFPKSTDPVNPIDGDIYFSDGTIRPKGFWNFKDGSWKRLGSSSGELNFYENGDADNDASTSNFFTGNNATFDNGGVLAGTFTLSSSAPDIINGQKVFRYDESATAINNTNDYIASELIDIPQGYRGQLLAFKGKYKTNKSDDSIRLELKDNTNNIILSKPSDTLKQFFNADNTAKGFSLTFFCPYNCSQIKVGVQNVTGEVSKYLIFDDLVVTPNFAISANLTDDYDWIPYTPITVGLGTLTNVAFWHKRVGDTMFIRGNATTGIVSATSIKISLPSGNFLDITKLTSTTSDALGHFIRMATATPIYQFDYIAFSDGTDTSNIFISAASASTTSLAKSNGNNAMVTGDSFSLFLEIPIQGWSATAPGFLAYTEKNAIDSQSTATNANGYGSTATVIRKYSNQTTVGSAILYTSSSVNGDSWTIKDNGIYHISASDGTGALNFGFTINQVTLTTGISSLPVNQVLIEGGVGTGVEGVVSWCGGLREGDIIRCNTNGGTGTSTTTARFVITKIGVPGLLGLPKNQTVYLKDVKSSGTDGGTFTSGSWQTRVLNTIEGDSTIVSLSSNQFTLQPGRYEFYTTAPADRVNNHKAKLRNITDSTDQIIGSSERSLNTTGQVSNKSVIEGIVEITSPKIFEVQHQCQTTQTVVGFGDASSFGVSEVYTQVKITKVA
jgi:hypothetical protein